MSLTTPYDPNNIFAKMIKGEIPCVKIYEDDDILSFMDIFPQTEGHSLVIPKNAEATNLFEIDAEPLTTLVHGVQKVARAVRTGLEADGVRIAQFNGAPAGQTVFHIHFHIIPVYEGDALRAHGAGEQADPAALEEIASRIRSAF